MHPTSFALIAALALAGLSGCAADSQASAGESFSEHSEKVHAAFRTAKIDGAPSSVRPEADGFLYGEVRGEPVFYRVAGDSVYIFTGNVVRVEGETIDNLTERKTAERNHAALGQLNLDDAIVYPRTGPGDARLVVFTDPSCPYCTRLHQELPELLKAGVEVVYLPMPRAGLDSEPGLALQAVMCAPDRRAAMDQAFSKGYKGMAPAKNCSAQEGIERAMKLADRLRVNGTPAVYAVDGRQLGGYLPPQGFLAALSKKG